MQQWSDKGVEGNVALVEPVENDALAALYKVNSEYARWIRDPVNYREFVNSVEKAIRIVHAEIGARACQ